MINSDSNSRFSNGKEIKEIFFESSHSRSSKSVYSLPFRHARFSEIMNFWNLSIRKYYHHGVIRKGSVSAPVVIYLCFFFVNELRFCF